MPKPSGAAASYFIDVTKMLSNISNNEEQGKTGGSETKEKLNQIGQVLNLSNIQLKGCEHPTDITKSCRGIIKHLYPDFEARTKMLISLLPIEKLHGICNYIKIIHPSQCSISTHTLNNAIGNVFSAKRKKKNDSAKQ
ncbi:unnamed protein product [Rotaria sordida]|uniref:Uncharacterized protein n=1 Tax=Rotaria sordida TaxID=392033 RepID=A0A814NGB2_9BILA|nr:unnamed protein product [Rotaria sordida]